MLTFVLFLVCITAIQLLAAWALARCFKYVDTVDAIVYAMPTTTETN